MSSCAGGEWRGRDGWGVEGELIERRSEDERTEKRQVKRAIMTEPEPKKKSKKEIEQERLSFVEAIRLQEQMNEEQRAHIARDEEIARPVDESKAKSYGEGQ
ncbi:hypothetical protein Tco_0953847 [Tanacetum coccineum]|uniref:Uncharacterized protein n=1 Tax=Tanacetum coccineum TaxID=301880 RepID=A0ABQ5E112_9ASTR